jgi:hypothetical protein
MKLHFLTNNTIIIFWYYPFGFQGNEADNPEFGRDVSIV